MTILTSSLFDGGYRRYHFRGDNNRNMSVESYFSKIIPYLKVLIDENKVHEQKIQYVCLLVLEIKLQSNC